MPINAPADSANRATWLTFAIILAGLTLSLLVHLNLSGSNMTLSPDDWRPTLDLHLHERPFYMRPLQSLTTIGLARVTGLTERDAFFVVQYALMALTAYLFFRLLLMVGFSRTWGHTGMVCFFLSLPVVAAFFAPIHTWDDFWLYLFLILLAMALLRHRWVWAAVCFFFACLARETALFFLPVLFIMAWRDRHIVRWEMLSTCLIAPLAAFYGYSSQFTDAYGQGPWKMLGHNFGDLRNVPDSVVSLINAFGWMLPAAFIGWCLLARRNRTNEETFLFVGLLWYWQLNTIASATLAMVRETRLLFPPFIFVIPLALYAVREMAPAWRGWRQLSVLAVVVAALGVDGVWLGRVLHPTFAYGASSSLRRDYAGLSLGLSVAFLILWFVARRHKKAAPETGAA